MSYLVLALGLGLNTLFSVEVRGRVDGFGLVETQVSAIQWQTWLKWHSGLISISRSV